ncbi:MAG TPA: response regulator transcription factor [Candidatus Sulfotelmatobacter sp.]|jgi:DNA-binding response OmpR family regulator|nr:response regulator transcription factor [Candidatus Sulfotelmatobacter sp.]
MTERVIVVEDDDLQRSDLVSYLTSAGFDCVGLANASEMRQFLETQEVSCVILDVNLPDGNGLCLLTDIRTQRKTACGVIMLSAYAEPGFRIGALDQGADAYLHKSVSLKEIEATLRNILRRLPSSPPRAAAAPATTEESWLLDRKSWRLAAPHGIGVTLSGMELELLEILAENIGKACSRTFILKALARKSHDNDRNLDAAVFRLRRKIEKQTGLEAPIKSVYGVGYVMTEPCDIS